MTEHAEDPVGQASSKIVQYVSLATMAAEALAQRAQQRAAAAAATEDKATAALRAQQNAARSAARLQWRPVLDPHSSASNSLEVAGLAWAASRVWRDVDPEAALAGDRALARMRELRPDVMARFDRLTRDGVDEVEAIRRLAPFFAHPAAREHGTLPRQQLTVGEPDAAPQAAAESAERATPGQSAQFARQSAAVDDAHASDSDERLQAEALADPRLRGATDLGARAAALQGDADLSAEVEPGALLAPPARLAPQLAGDAYPERLTGEVLAAGQVKPRTPSGPALGAARELAAATREGGRSR